jgi:general secretion pathway protein B
MSSILKALEKAEESQSVRRDGGPGGFKKPRERRRPWLVPAAVVGGAAFAALATFAAMGGFSRPAAPVATVDAVTAPAQAVNVAPPGHVMDPMAEKAAEAASVEASQNSANASDAAAAEAVPVPPPVAVPVSKPEMDAVAKRVTGGAGRVVRTPVRAAVASAAPASAKGSRQQPAVHPLAVQAAAVQAAAVQAAAQKVTASAAVQTAVVAEAAAAAKPKRAEIRVTGIAWQKDSASSGVIVNGRMLQQGGTVEGYKIEQILEDKVIFSGSGGKMEVPLSAGE